MQTSAAIAGISSEVVSVYLQRLEKPGAFAVFNLPDRTMFAQVKRVASGGLIVEVSKRTHELEALLGTLGDVDVPSDVFAFPTVISRPGDDGRVGQVVAEALAILATNSHCVNETRVRTGQG